MQALSIEQQFIESINANAGQGDRFVERVYADWLDELGDPRAEGWCFLLKEGKRPELWFGEEWHWFKSFNRFPTHQSSRLDNSLFHVHPGSYDGFETYFEAVNAAAIAWVRRNRDEDGPKRL